MVGIRIVLTMTCIFVPLFSAYAQTPDTLWARTYGGVNSDECFEMCQTSDSGFALAGFTNSFGPAGWNVYLIRTDEIGDTLWTRAYGGSTHEYGHCICTSSDGGFVIGGTQQSGDYDIYVTKTDSAGDVIWTKTYGGMMNDMADGVCQSADQGYIITGAANVNNYMTSGDLVLLKLDTNGDTTWVKTYGGSAYDFGSAICRTDDGGYAICGFTNSFGSGGTDIWLLKTDVNGDTSWTRTFGGSDNDEAWALRQTVDGGYILTGYTASYGVGNWDVYVLKTNSAGDSVWAATFGGPHYDVGMSVIQAADNGFVVAGTCNGNDGWVGGDLWLLKIDVNGDTVWTSTIAGNAEDWGYSVHQTGDGGFAVGGKTWSFGAGQCDVYLVRYGPETGSKEHRGAAPANSWFGTTMLNESLVLPVGKHYCVYDISGRIVDPARLCPGIYFIEIDGMVTQKIIKVR